MYTVDETNFPKYYSAGFWQWVTSNAIILDVHLGNRSVFRVNDLKPWQHLFFECTKYLKRTPHFRFLCDCIMSSSSRRTPSGSQSPQHTLTSSRSRSSVRISQRTSLGVDEGSALSDLHKKVSVWKREWYTVGVAVGKCVWVSGRCVCVCVREREDEWVGAVCVCVHARMWVHMHSWTCDRSGMKNKVSTDLLSSKNTCMPLCFFLTLFTLKSACSDSLPQFCTFMHWNSYTCM